MTGFESRLAKGVEFETDLKAWLASRPSIRAVVANGTEHTHPDFVSLLRNDRSPAAKFVRFAPDGAVLHKSGVIHYDAKAAKAIEKDAYETYMNYVSCGCRVVLFVKNGETVYCRDIQHVRLIDGNETISKFPENRRFPVDEDGWICPRLSRNQLNGRMSGTPYKEIDFASMNPVDIGINQPPAPSGTDGEEGPQGQPAD